MKEGSVRLKEAAVLEVILENDVCDGFKDELDIGRVRGTSEVGVDLLLTLLLVQLLELETDEGRSSLVRVRTWEEGRDSRVQRLLFTRRERALILSTCVVREADGEGTSFDLVLKEVFFVEEENDGRVREPLGVADGVEELHGLHHPVHLLVLRQHQVVA